MEHVTKYPLVKLPQHTQICVFLIREELKSRKLFRALHQAGIHDCYLQPHLEEVIFELMDLEHSDEAFHTFNKILERRSKKIDASGKSLMKQTLKVYHELLEEKKLMGRG